MICTDFALTSTCEEQCPSHARLAAMRVAGPAKLLYGSLGLQRFAPEVSSVNAYSGSEMVKDADRRGPISDVLSMGLLFIR